MANSFFVSSAKKNSDEMNAIETAAKENLESQRRQCIVERRKKYERHCIASKLLCTEDGGCRINGKSGQFNGSNEVQKVAKQRTPSEKVGIGDSFQVNNAGIASNVHCWKERTTLIAGDSMLNGLAERQLSNKGSVKAHAFPGCTIADLHC